MTANRGFNLPTAAEPGCGYIYVAVFSNDIIKCGSTARPRSRLRRHAGNAAGFGLGLHDYWLSHEHHSYLEAETRLLNQVAGLGGRRTQREYFEGLDYVQVVNVAQRVIEAAEQPADTPVYDAKGWQLFSLSQVAMRYGFTVGHLMRGIRNGWFVASLVDGAYGFTEYQMRDLLEAHVLGPGRPEPIWVSAGKQVAA